MASASLNKDGRSVLVERLFILLACSAYLIVFNVNLPHGDALRIVTQIQSENLAWNPNHLTFDPLGYYWFFFLKKLGFDISELGSFEIISSLATLVSVFLFHMVLVEAGIRIRYYRLIAVVALFASKNFLAMAITQYYFMIQMPFLLGALYYLIKFVNNSDSTNGAASYLYLAGIFTAIATTLEINNVLLVFLLGVVVAVSIKDKKITWIFPNTIRLWGAAAAVGFPVYFAGYYLSGSNHGFLSWLLAYGGGAGSSLDSFYGIQWTVMGVVTSFARMSFNFLFGNIIETAGLGTVAWSIITGTQLEFLPDTLSMTLATVLMPFVGLLLMVLVIWALRNFKSVPILLYLLVWILSYLIFAFYWNNGSDIFWFQTLPAIWLLLIFAVQKTFPDGVDARLKPVSGWSWRLRGLTVLVVVLFFVNTMQTVVPVSLIDIEARTAEHRKLLRAGDLEITTGWDRYKWMGIDEADPEIRQLMMMNMVFQPEDSATHISKLSQIIANQLDSGQRVIIARLFDLDAEMNPWGGLTHAGWSRARIIASLKQYCNREIGMIDDVVFRELYICNQG